jgi:hypothetical protein
MKSHSLKGIVSDLAGAVGYTPAALYERQRALGRAGLLQVGTGRGPGSGVRATPRSVALLLISVLATDSLSETVERTKALAAFQSTATGKQCPVTGKRTFGEALAAILTSRSWNDRWISAVVMRTENQAALVFDSNELVSKFAPSKRGRALDPQRNPDVFSGLTVRVTLVLPSHFTDFLRPLA